MNSQATSNEPEPHYFKRLSESTGAGWNRFWFRAHDPINLGLLRVLVGLLALWYLASFCTELTGWFGPDGWLPVDTTSTLNELFEEAGQNPDLQYQYHWSYLNYATTPSELRIAHAVGLIVVGLFTVGCYTRVSSIASLIVVLAYFHRAPMLVGQFEPVLAMVLFYLCLAPAGATLSWDAWRKGRRAPERISPKAAPATSWSANLALRLIQVHTVALYLLIGWSKMNSDAWWNGFASWWLIASPDSRLIDLTFLRSMPYVLYGLTHGIVMVEIAYAILIWNRLARPILITCSLLSWCFLALVTGLVGYSLVMIVLNVAFLDPAAIRRTLEKCRRKPKQVESVA